MAQLSSYIGTFYFICIASVYRKLSFALTKFTVIFVIFYLLFFQVVVMAMVQNFVTYLVQSLQLKLLARNTNTALSRYTNSLKFVLFAVIIRFKFNTFSIFHKNNHAHSNVKCYSG